MLQNITILFVKIIPFLVQQNVGLVRAAVRRAVRGHDLPLQARYGTIYHTYYVVEKQQNNNKMQNPAIPFHSKNTKALTSAEAWI
jgi:hypothetical protein